MKLKLIKKSEKTPGPYNTWYDPIPHLKKQIDNETPDVTYTACRVHNIRLKYAISEQIGEISTDKRTGYFTSWEMRGGERYKFFIPGTAGKPDITIDVHPKTIVAYPDAGQTVYAESIEESETLIITAIHEAVLKFLQKQRLFNTHIEIKNPSLAGKIISKIHYGFKFLKNSPFAQEQTDLKDFYIDGSPEKQGEKGYSEFETENKTAATTFDRCIKWMIDAGKVVNQNPFLVIFNELEKLNRQMRILTEITQGAIS